MKPILYFFQLLLIFTLISCSGSGGTSTNNSPNPPPTPPTPAPTSNLNFLETTTGISDTIYANQLYSNISFTFISNETTPQTINTVKITNSANINLTQKTDNCTGETLNQNNTCSISFNSAMITDIESYGNILFNLSNTNGESYNYQMNLYGIAKINGYAPMRIITPLTGTGTIYAVALVGGIPSYPYAVPILYQLTNGQYLGNIQTTSVGSLANYTINVPPGGVTLYTPVMLNHGQNAGGRFYLSYNSPLTATQGAMPSSTQSVPYLYYEYNVPALNSVFTDMSYVDSTSVPVSITSLNKNNNINKQMGVKPEFYNYSGQQIIQNMKTAMSQYTGVYNLSAYFNINDANLIAVLSPSTIFTQPTIIPTGFESAFFNTYTDDLWDYYKQSANYVVINGDEIANQVNGSNCQLRGHVENDNLMHFVPYPSATNCPEGTYIAAGQTFNTGTNNFTLQKSDLNYYAFYSGFANQTIYGVNGTYQSLLKYIAGAQAAGFFPFCASNDGSPTFVYGHAVLTPYAQQFFKANYNCLANYNFYGEKVINQYDQQVHTYFNSYGYAYDDAIGIDGTVSSDASTFPSTVYVLKFAN